MPLYVSLAKLVAICFKRQWDPGVWQNKLKSQTSVKLKFHDRHSLQLISSHSVVWNKVYWNNKSTLMIFVYERNYHKYHHDISFQHDGDADDHKGANVYDDDKQQWRWWWSWWIYFDLYMDISIIICGINCLSITKLQWHGHWGSGMGK